MSFGFSVGDFIAIGTLIKDICHCLRNNKGSAAEYQELLRELECLQRVLCHLDRLQGGSSSLSSNIDSIKYAALSCRHPLEQFLHKIQKYDTSLGVCGNDGALKSAKNKLRWGFSMKEEVAKLQSYLNIHIGTINILLAEHGLEKLNFVIDRTTASQLDIRERLSETHNIVRQCSGSLAAQTMVLQNTQGMLAKLCRMIGGEFHTSWRTVEDMVAKVCVSTQQIYTILLEIRTSLARPDVRWTFFQDPFLVEDALGYKFPVPSEYDFALLDAVVKHKFSTGPGSMEVQNSNYEYFKTKDSSSVVCGASKLLPGMAITMAIVVMHSVSTSDACPTPSCGSIDTIENPGGGRTCSECNVWFSTTDRRLKYLYDLPVTSSVTSNPSVTEYQLSKNTDPKEDKPVFKNIRLSLTKTVLESYIESVKEPSAASTSSTSRASTEYSGISTGPVSLDDGHPYSFNVDSVGKETLNQSEKAHAACLREFKLVIPEDLLTQQTVQSRGGQHKVSACTSSFAFSPDFALLRSRGHQFWYCCLCNDGPKSIGHGFKCLSCGHGRCCFCERL